MVKSREQLAEESLQEAAPAEMIQEVDSHSKAEKESSPPLGDTKSRKVAWADIAKNTSGPASYLM